MSKALLAFLLTRNGQKAADKGNTDATYVLGMLYAKAREWCEKAADKGNTDAMYVLGMFYANGEGVAQDYVKAREWYEKARC